MDRLQQRTTLLVNSLIERLTDLQGESKNFKIAQQFVFSNIKYHRFLDVNELKVTRNMNGLCEKFKVHSQEEKAETLRLLVDKFLGTKLEHNFPKSDVHFAILKLLLCLSNSPVNSEYIPNKNTSGEAVSDEEIDWYKLLTEDIDPPFYGEDTESEWSLSDEESSQTSQEEEAQEISSTSSTEDRPPALPVKENSFSEISLENEVFDPHQPVGSEYQIMRETLWLLQGSCSVTSGVYKIQPGGDVIVGEGVQLHHLSSVTLKGFLKYFAEKGTVLKKIESTILLLERQGRNSPTISGFGNCLRTFLQMFRKRVGQIEKDLVNSRHLTALELAVLLRKELRDVDTVHDITNHCKPCLVEGLPDTEMWQMISLVFDDLWQSLCNGIMSNDVRSVNLLLPLWSITMQPYLKQLHAFLQTGDPQLDVVVTRTAPRGLYDPRTWIIEEDHLEDVSLLTPVLKLVYQAGKSIALMKDITSSRKLDCAFPISQVNRAVMSRDLLNNVFIDNIAAILSKPEETGGAPEAANISQAATSTTAGVSLNVVLGGVTCNEGPLRYFEKILRGKSEKEKSCCIKETPSENCSCHFCIWKRFSKNDASTPTFPDVLLNSALYQPISERCLFASSLLVRILKEEFQLFDHLKNIQNVFLMGAGEVMNHFCSEFFSSIRHSHAGFEASFLHTILLESLHSGYQHLEKYLKVNVLTSDTTGSKLGCLSRLQLDYQVSGPPVVIINKWSLSKYNNIFHFLLNIKYAKWTIEQCLLRACDLPALATQEYSTHHRLHLLKGKLLYFVNCIESFIMTRILHSAGLDFQKRLDEASSLEEIVSCHLDYILLISDRCLLNSKASFIKETILEIFAMCISFSEIWHRGTLGINLSNLAKLEADFYRCSHFLTTFLVKSVKQRHLNHLETLSLSLSFLEAKM